MSVQMATSVLFPRWSGVGNSSDKKYSDVGYGGRIHNIWHVIYWLYMHRTYYRVGIVLSEYCLKMLLSHMEPKEASAYKQMFKRMGINIDKLTFGSIAGAFLGIGSEGRDGEQGLFVSLPGASLFDFNMFLNLIQKIHDTERNLWKLLVNDIGTPIQDLRSLIERLFERIVLLAHVPSSFFSSGQSKKKDLKAMHREFAAYLLSLDKEWKNKEAVIQQSRIIYGGSHWLDVGLSAIETKFEESRLLAPNGPKPTLNEVSDWLDVEHNHWQHWSLSFVDIINRLKPEILSEIQKAEEAIYKLSNK